MKLEHFALNVAHPLEMAEWYVKHLQLRIVKQQKEEPFTTFMADNSGKMMIEIYKNPIVAVPDYFKMNPLVMHVAFVSKNPEDDKKYLLSVGATFETETKLDDGSHLVMLRDPWGISIQLCRRAVNMLE